MQKKEAKNGMKVVISRGGPRAARATGIVRKCNPTRAKVEITEQFNSRPAGTMFNVPYELMEPLPANGDKNSVSFRDDTSAGGNDTEIVVGTTTFRSTYADSNALWKVIRKEGRNYRCQIENERIEIDGKWYDGDYAGQQKIFSPEEILGSIGMSKLWQGLADKHDDFYASLKPGQIIHYNNGFDNWVRCEVVRDGGENKLKPIALVGEWREYDLPRRMRDGSIHNGYHADKIITGETMTPNASNLFEAGCKPRNGINPNTLSPISLAVPAMTDEEDAKAKLWQKIAKISETVNDSKTDDPQIILNRVARLVNG